MARYIPLVWLFVFGSLWGLSEVVGGKALYEANIPHASVYLSASGFFLLALARGLFNKRGTSSVIGGMAALFRLVNASFVCHILGIFLMGVAFDLAASILLKGGKKGFLRSSLTGITGAYGGYALFALIITYVVRYEIWVVGGLPKVLDHVFVTGSIGAAVAGLLVPLGYVLGIKGRTHARLESRWAFSAPLIFIVILWTLGRIAG
ncbi:MAG: hypothetical protein GTN53_33435 [Candidatus Aminicenantes bacterium]|nr:hypothetical protein [Candidatus Aenigmarchaeota archaeon]NIO85458.1 hypothetical protein [Candidatus Aminicenantes bacterium]NIQ71363.1 hypothetical protein [Candidatus Aminicenantes bacterium]NIT27416.1 hypothetical protein [Candidatus Aminicenantes bacterium]